MVDGDAAMYCEAEGAEVEGATYELLLLPPCGVAARRWEEVTDDDDGSAADEVIVSGEVEKSDMASCSEVVWIGMGRVTPAKATTVR